MTRLRALFAILTLVAVALLPGPSHALVGAIAAKSAAIGHHHATPSAHADAGAPQDGHHHHHGPCKTCSIACCAPAIATVGAPAIFAAGGLRLRPPRPAEDRERADAAQARALRPPTPPA